MKKKINPLEKRKEVIQEVLAAQSIHLDPDDLADNLAYLESLEGTELFQAAERIVNKGYRHTPIPRSTAPAAQSRPSVQVATSDKVGPDHMAFAEACECGL